MNIMSQHWFLLVLVIIAVAPFAIAVVTLLQQGDTLLAAGLMVVFLVWVIVLLTRLLQKQSQDSEAENTDQEFSTSLAAAESPPAYDVVIKSPPPYISYPGHGGIACPAPTMYYCYCGSGNHSTASASCKLCNSQSHVPFIMRLDHGTSHPDGNQASSDPFLPSYSEAVKVYTYKRGETTHL